jgi:alpha-beta hydrolase superfamily lysophospholipase
VNSRLGALAEAGVASLRFDLRGHGQSEGRMEELTPAAVLNDIRVASAQVRELTGAGSVSLLGASFGGGICAYYRLKPEGELTAHAPTASRRARTAGLSPASWVAGGRAQPQGALGAGGPTTPFSHARATGRTWIQAECADSTAPGRGQGSALSVLHIETALGFRS